MKWCIDGGMIFPKLEYPAYFEDGLIGVRATQKIEHRESFLAIPYKFLITVNMVQNHEVLGKIVKENPDLFGSKCGDYEQMTLCLMLIY